MDNTSLKAACLAATLATAWSTAPAEAATTLKLESNWSGTLTLSYLVTYSGLTYLKVTPVDLVSSGRQTFVIRIEDDSASPDFYAIVGGKGSGGGTDYHVMSTFAAASTPLGIEFETVFPGVDERQLLLDLYAGNGNDLTKFASAIATNNLGVPVGESSNAVLFSAGTAFGTAIVTVPEPASLTFVVLAAAPLMFRWRSGQIVRCN